MGGTHLRSAAPPEREDCYRSQEFHSGEAGLVTPLLFAFWRGDFGFRSQQHRSCRTVKAQRWEPQPPNKIAATLRAQRTRGDITKNTRARRREGRILVGARPRPAWQCAAMEQSGSQAHGAKLDCRSTAFVTSEQKNSHRPFPIGSLPLWRQKGNVQSPPLPHRWGGDTGEENLQKAINKKQETFQEFLFRLYMPLEKRPLTTQQTREQLLPPLWISHLDKKRNISPN